MANETHGVKVSGYLEKKAKLRIGSPWKKYWFVLEGRLLLYYRSKDEYETLSPCKGSINLCPPCNVKPALSAAKVFQIECRASTVTLKAESRSEQQRWLQALLAAIAQSNSSPNRMSHFRYSLDDLPLSTSKDKKNRLCRQNTMPYGASPLNKNNDCMVERLQKIGAHTYGGSLETINKLASKHEKPPIKQQDLLRKLSDNSLEILRHAEGNIGLGNKGTPKSHSAERICSIFIENEQYSIIQEENSLDLALEKKLPHAEYVMVDNNQYISSKKDVEQDDQKQSANGTRKSLIVENDQYDVGNNNNDICIRSKNRVEHLYERISTDSNASDSNPDKNNSTKKSFNKIRQITSNLYERISTSSSNSDSQINHQYCIVQNDAKNTLVDTEYTIPFNSEIMDSNKDEIVNEPPYSPTVDDVSKHLYSDGLLFSPEYIEYAAIDKSKEYEDMYANPDYLKKSRPEDVEPKLPPRPEKHSEETISLTSSNEEKKCKIGKFKLLLRKEAEKKVDGPKSPNARKKSNRKSVSFLHKVWRRKTKSLETDNVTNEPIDYESVEKQIAKDKNDIEMLQELQRILETRKNMLQEKLSANGNKKDNAIQQTNSSSKIKEESIETSRLCTETTQERPTLPPRQRSLRLSNEVFTSHNEVPENSQNVTLESLDIKSIDEILIDLDNEKNLQDAKQTVKDSKQNVKQLIEKFSDIKPDEVVLRKKPNSPFSKNPPLNLRRDPSQEVRDSDELTFLLEELSKVTSAPVLTPGATSSLVTPTLSDEEWLKLIPIRHRRLSDPDYDVPRPHRSLQLYNRFKEMPENAIPATRFFGPILHPSENATKRTNVILNSIDPDSLELTSSLESNNGTVVEKGNPEISYTSHKYLKINLSHPKQTGREIALNNQNIETNEKPIKENIEDTIKNKTSTQTLLKSEELFADSLEPLTEMSTAF